MKKASLLDFIPPIKQYHLFRKSITNRITIWQYIKFLFKKDKRIYWPVHPNSEITHPNNIFVGINSNVGSRPGCYIQGNGGIRIGNYVHMASNIGIISGNHDFYNHLKHNKKEVIIDDYCWIGQGAIILPGVHLGKRTIVAAGAVVTKSFPNGFCVVGGNPAKIIKLLNPSLFKPYMFKSQFYGFIPDYKFHGFAKKTLSNNKYIHYINSIIQEIPFKSKRGGVTSLP